MVCGGHSALVAQSWMPAPPHVGLQLEPPPPKISAQQTFVPVQLALLEQANEPPWQAPPLAMHVDPEPFTQHSSVVASHEAVPQVICPMGAPASSVGAPASTGLGPPSTATGGGGGVVGGLGGVLVGNPVPVDGGEEVTVGVGLVPGPESDSSGMVASEPPQATANDVAKRRPIPTTTTFFMRGTVKARPTEVKAKVVQNRHLATKTARRHRTLPP